MPRAAATKRTKTSSYDVAEHLRTPEEMAAYLDAWLHIKFALVVVLSAMHGMNVRYWRDFEADRRIRTARYYKIVNEIPAVLMVLIVILVVVKPFGG